MKTLSYYIILLALLCAGCSKDKPVNSIKPKTYLLKSVSSTPFNRVDDYTYDDKNRVIEIHSVNTLRDYQYTYDNKNNLLTAKTFDLGSNNNLLGSDVYSYSANKVTVAKFNADGSSTGSYNFVLNDQKEVTKVNFGSADDYEEDAYDGNGNLTSTADCCTLVQSDTYHYDNQKHPLSQMGAVNYHMMFLAAGAPQSFVNNVTNDDVRGTITYSYNNDGFPLTATVTGAFPSLTTYTYIVK